MLPGTGPRLAPIHIHHEVQSPTPGVPRARESRYRAVVEDPESPRWEDPSSYPSREQLAKHDEAEREEERLREDQYLMRGKMHGPHDPEDDEMPDYHHEYDHEYDELPNHDEM